MAAMFPDEAPTRRPIARRKLRTIPRDSGLSSLMGRLYIEVGHDRTPETCLRRGPPYTHDLNGVPSRASVDQRAQCEPLDLRVASEVA